LPKERTTRAKEVLGTVEIAAKMARFGKDGAPRRGTATVAEPLPIRAVDTPEQ
jgi:hypothetical protein